MKMILVFLFFLCTTVAGVLGAAETCAAVNGSCSSNGGTCATECVAKANVKNGTVAPTCPCSTPTEGCSWKCQGATEKCAAVDNPCGNNGGKCATECVVTADVKHGAGEPTCTCATAGQSCSWKCQVATEKCAAVDNPCGNNGGKCATECVVTAHVKTGAGAPTCTCATAGQSCSWKCQVGGGGSGTHGQPSNTGATEKCAAVDDPCGSNGGKCATECVAAASVKAGAGAPTCACATAGQSCSWKCQGSDGKNSPTKSGTGSIKHGLSPLILMCGILAKLLLSA
ncbi:keratin-associated protein 5-1-like [Mizuhopecten yessoensis]|uniref:keratin-associated protein 5-1-like n=1 Tax=Mizuhopecten yessoensis TaxID=6573 RepID=UPI000B45AC57|nr:keratin-associated protein 5-1-like [Mizuhopecten yessoensis]